MKNNFVIRGLYFLYSRISNFFLGRYKFNSIGTGTVIVPPFYSANYKNISIGEKCGIGRDAYVSALNAKVIIKDHCAIAEGLTIHTGNHVRVPGLFVTQIKEKDKPQGYDKDVIIEEDVWIGCNVTLLSGVTIGRGTTVAAGAVVSKSMPPYCVCGGVPAKVIKFYWTIDQILEHETKLYSEKDRYKREQLEELFKKYNP